jgi:hypothetical protein
MKPIYFPFTHASERVAKALVTCFGSFSIYQPMAGNVPEQMRTWVDNGVLDLRIPVAEGERELKTAAKNYLDWVSLHTEGTGMKAASLKTLKRTLPSFDHLLSSHIVTDIKKQNLKGSTAQAPDFLMAARVFLYFAQKFDLQSQEVDRDLKRYRQKEEGLIRELKMEEDFLAVEFQKNQIQMPNTSADYLFADRLEAWTRIFLKDSEISGLFVTHSPIILDHLLDRSSAAKRLLQLESMPLGAEMTAANDSWPAHLVSILADVVENKRPLPDCGQIDIPAYPEAEDTISLSIYLLPDQHPRDLFSRCTNIKPSDGDRPYRTDRFKNTLIGLIEF